LDFLLYLLDITRRLCLKKRKLAPLLLTGIQLKNQAKTRKLKKIPLVPVKPSRKSPKKEMKTRRAPWLWWRNWNQKLCPLLGKRKAPKLTATAKVPALNAMAHEHAALATAAANTEDRAEKNVLVLRVVLYRHGVLKCGSALQITAVPHTKVVVLTMAPAAAAEAPDHTAVDHPMEFPTNLSID
jgi:hypothetical protein